MSEHSEMEETNELLHRIAMQLSVSNRMKAKEILEKYPESENWINSIEGEIDLIDTSEFDFNWRKRK